MGPARAALLEKAGFRTPEDVLTNYPRDWQDRRRLYAIREAPIGLKTTLQGRIRQVTFSTLRPGLGL